MIKVKKLSEDLKINYPNMDYQIILNGEKRYFTEKAIIELRTKLNLLTIPDVVEPKGKLVCDRCGSDKLEDCCNNEYACEDCGHFPITN